MKRRMITNQRLAEFEQYLREEDITLPTAFVDKYTIVMLIIAIVQTVMVALSNKKYEDEQEV